MRRLFVLTVLLSVLSPLPALAQQREWRLTTRLTSLSLDADTGSVLDTGTRIESNSSELTINFEGQYMMADAWAFCFSLTTSPFDLEGKAGVYDQQKLGEIWYAPLTLTVRYEFQLMGKFQPYVGGGLAVSGFFADDLEPALEAEGIDDIDIDIGYGWVVEVGLNYELSKNTFATLDLKMMDVSTDLDLIDADDVTIDTIDFDGSPMQIGLGIGCRW